jgi:GTP cyclohydrolase II
MQGADKGQAGRLDGHDLRVGIVQARFNDELTSRMAALCIEELTALGVQRMRLMGNQRRMPSMVGYELEVVGFLTADGTQLDPSN